jgi:hypothetical protein
MSDEQPPTAARRRLAAVFTEQNLFWVSVVFVLLAPIVIGLTSNATIAWLTLVCGTFVAMMSKFESLAELTIGPLKVKMREVAQESRVLQARLDVALKELAAAKAEAKLLSDRASADAITIKTDAAVEAVTAAMRANDVIITTAEPQGRTVTRDFSAAMEIPPRKAGAAQ